MPLRLDQPVPPPIAPPLSTGRLHMGGCKYVAATTG
jgi:hypothetical protein